MKKIRNGLLLVSFAIAMLLLAYRIIDLYIIQLSFWKFLLIDSVSGLSLLLIIFAESQLNKSVKHEEKTTQP